MERQIIHPTTHRTTSERSTTELRLVFHVLTKLKKTIQSAVHVVGGISDV